MFVSRSMFARTSGHSFGHLVGRPVQLGFSGLLDWKVGGLVAPEAGIIAGQTACVRNVCSVTLARAATT
jgi:hypothetical protein